MAKKRNPIIGCLVILLIAAGITISVWQKNKIQGIAFGAGFLVMMLLLARLLRPRRCEICGNVLQRASYKWKFGKDKKRVCPHCNQSLQRKQSKAAMRQFR
jgi:hypothetical protein